MSSFLIVSILFYDDKVCRKLRDQQCRRDSILWANRKTLLFILFRPTLLAGALYRTYVNVRKTILESVARPSKHHRTTTSPQMSSYKGKCGKRNPKMQYMKLYLKNKCHQMSLFRKIFGSRKYIRE